MVATPTRRTAFAGIDGNDTDVTFPSWFRDLVDAPAGDIDRPTFLNAVNRLPLAQKRGVAYWDNEADEWRADDHHVAIVNPAWLGDGLTDPDAPDSAVWHVATGRYTCVNPMDVYGPLTAAIRRYNANDENDRPLGAIFGQIREYRNGGEVHLDLAFDGLTVTDPGTDAGRFVLGLQSGTDHFGGRSTYARIVVFDTEGGVVMRGLTERRKRKHTGAATNAIVDWWSEVLATLETAAETIFGIVSSARDYTVDFSERPFDPEGFYDCLGFPEGLAKQAAGKLPTGSMNGRIDAWSLYYAMAETLTHDYDAKDEGGALNEKLSLANRILFEPPYAEAAVLKEAEKRLISQQTLSEDDEEAADYLAAERESITETLDTYTSTRKRLTTILRDAEDAQGVGA